MGNATPSMTALLGLLAIAGYQNRDKLADLLGGGGHGAAPAGSAQTAPSSVPPTGTPASGGGLAGVLAGLTGGRDVGSFLNGGLNDLVDHFKQGGQGAATDSWVNHGPNQPIGPQQMEQAIGADTLSTLTAETGLSREEVLARLSRELPQAVDNYTPDGRLPPRG